MYSQSKSQSRDPSYYYKSNISLFKVAFVLAKGGDMLCRKTDSYAYAKVDTSCLIADLKSFCIDFFVVSPPLVEIPSRHSLPTDDP